MKLLEASETMTGKSLIPRAQDADDEDDDDDDSSDDDSDEVNDLKLFSAECLAELLPEGIAAMSQPNYMRRVKVAPEILTSGPSLFLFLAKAEFISSHIQRLSR